MIRRLLSFFLAFWLVLLPGMAGAPTPPSIPNSTAPTFRANINTAFSTTYTDLARLLHGQCRLVYVDSTHVRLDRFNGKYLIINGVAEEIPSAGVTLASTGLSATTLYYVYAYMSSGTMTLEAVTTAHSTDSVTGVEIKTGAATRTLVGMVYCPSSATFDDAPNSIGRLVASWFNRRLRMACAFPSGTTTSVSPAVEINSAERAKFIVWNDCDTELVFAGYAHNSTTASTVGLLSDGASTLGTNSIGRMTGTSIQTISGAGGAQLTEGYHELCFYGYVSSASTGTYDDIRIYAWPNI